MNTDEQNPKPTVKIIKKAVFNIAYYASKNIMLAGFIAMGVERKFSLLAVLITLLALVLTLFLEVIKLRNNEKQKEI